MPASTTCGHGSMSVQVRMTAKQDKGNLNICSNFTVSLCVLNQWALDFVGNTKRILQSIELSKKAGATYRLGPELELSGYGCEDHFHELDTFSHSWECLANILHETSINPDLMDIICDIGMPVLLAGVAYNCRVLILNGRVLFIRPKLVLADGGLHRETRWFTAWPHSRRYIKFTLPSVIQRVAKDSQETTYFGDALLRLAGGDSAASVLVGLETCEELWIGSPPHLKMFAAGADMVLNASASHHELRKLNARIDLVKMASRASGGGLYAYTNLRGCDSERVCYDGGAMAAVSGEIVCLMKQFGMEEVEVRTVTVDLNALRSKRITNKSFGRVWAAAAAVTDAGSSTSGYPVVEIDFLACHKADWPDSSSGGVPSQPLTNFTILKPEEEISQGPALWLWDMLRRSKSGGCFLCLSGGLDSASVACLVLSMCRQICDAIAKGSEEILKACCELLGDSKENVKTLTPRNLCSRIFVTCYMPSENSSKETCSRAARLAEAIGSHHLTANISSIVSCFVDTAVHSLNLPRPPRFTVDGGDPDESVALQNVQARSRMVLSYLLAQLLPRSINSRGRLLILSSANLDEGLSGYFTKYDCSSADVNPIGSISKTDLRRFLTFCADDLGKCLDPENLEKLRTVLHEIVLAPPTAELVPLKEGETVQTDEADLGLTYSLLSLFGRLRKMECCGPYSMLRRLLDGAWYQVKEDIPTELIKPNNRGGPQLAEYLSNKVKLFFRRYATNRHKATILPPAYHTEAYSADDNRFDLRPYLYPSEWTHQFACMDALVREWENQMK
ncbi:unnamed protein product [Calicophoron daubneyi]|uniref:Glutamine-dependent NAD(+) synthetase n=1 Tax=Calicophoron daubneyi TaxID=300641 RepID=A0AAV2T3E8_CALDB